MVFLFLLKYHHYLHPNQGIIFNVPLSNCPHNSIFIRSTDHQIFLIYIPSSTHNSIMLVQDFFFFFCGYNNPFVGFPASNLLPYPFYILLIIPLAILKIFIHSIKSKFIPVASSSSIEVRYLPFQFYVSILHIQRHCITIQTAHFFPHACHIWLSSLPSLRYVSPSEILLHPTWLMKFYAFFKCCSNIIFLKSSLILLNGMTPVYFACPK